MSEGSIRLVPERLGRTRFWSDTAMRSVTEINRSLWAGDNVARYDHRQLKPAEVVLLARYGSRIAEGRVLEIGCGAGRVLGYLTELSRDVTGIDVSPTMVAACRATYPQAQVRVEEMSGVSLSRAYDVVLVPDNTLDVVEPEERQLVLTRLASLLRRDVESPALLIFSAHNFEFGRPCRPRGTKASVRWALGWPHRRSRAYLEREGEGWALYNDPEGNWRAVHTYVDPAFQVEQLRAAGLETIDILDADGRSTSPSHTRASPWLYYVASVASVEA